MTFFVVAFLATMCMFDVDKAIVKGRTMAALNVLPQIGTIDAESETSVQTNLSFFLGTGGLDLVAGLNGGHYSAIRMPVASLEAVKQRPQIIPEAVFPSVTVFGIFTFKVAVSSLEKGSHKPHYFINTVSV